MHSPRQRALPAALCRAPCFGNFAAAASARELHPFAPRVGRDAPPAPAARTHLTPCRCFPCLPLRYGYRLDHFERKRKKEARAPKKESAMARKVKPPTCGPLWVEIHFACTGQPVLTPARHASHRNPAAHRSEG